MTTPNGRHFYPAHDTARVIFGNAHFALEALQKVEFNPSTAFENFKNENTAVINNVNNNFLQQDINQDPFYQDFIKSLDPIKKLEAKQFINRPELALPLLQTSEKKFQDFLKQQKSKLQQNSNGLSEADRKKLSSRFTEHLSQVYQPVANLAKELEPDCLLTNAMRHYVKKMGKKEGKPYGETQTGVINPDFTPRAQYIDSGGEPITMEYDKENKVKAIRLHPDKGNVGDALAIAIASHGKMLPLKITVPISNADIIKSEMDVGLVFFIILLMHTLVKHIERNRQKNQVLEAACKKGIPLKYISLVDNRGAAIPITPEEQKRLDKFAENWRKNYVAGLDEAQEEQAKPSLKPALAG